MDDHVERTDCHAGADEVDFVRPAAPSNVPNSDFIKPARKHPDAPDAVSEDQPNAEEEPQQEELDPRVQAELERLNKCTDEINQLELQLEEAQSVFRTLLTDSTQQLKATAARIGSAIDKARPYYEALEIAQKAQKECQVRTDRNYLERLSPGGSQVADILCAYLLIVCGHPLPSSQRGPCGRQRDNRSGRGEVPNQQQRLVF